MRYLIFICILYITFAVQAQVTEINMNDIIGCWTHSYEENKQDSKIQIYRHCDYKEFGPSRFRFKMDLRDSSLCSWYYLDPLDAHRMEEGTWTFNKEKNELIIFDLDGEVARRFIIEHVGTDIIKIKD